MLEPTFASGFFVCEPRNPRREARPGELKSCRVTRFVRRQQCYIRTATLHNEGDTQMNRQGFAVRSALLVGLTAITLAGPAVAQQQPNTGLGSSWPTDATDMSRAPGYHVYTWTNSGVKYIQVNDYAGNVLVAVATANGVFLPLPMGSSAKNLQAGSSSTTPATGGVTVYQDNSVQVTATPQTSGTMLFQAAAAPCDDPVQCSTHSP
jgi:hypothetical protein